MKRALGVAAVLVILVIGWSATRPSRDTPSAKGKGDGVSEPARAPRVQRARGSSEAERAEEADDKRAPPPLRKRIQSKAIDPHPVHSLEEQAAANQKSIIEAKESGKYPERLDPKVAPAPFDHASWDRDPQAYLDVVEPGRVWHTAEESSGAEPLDPDSPLVQTVEPGGQVKLAVVSEPLSPVTFTVQGDGQLDNGLSSITLRANPSGYARVVYSAPSTASEVTIVVGSPMSTGQVDFTIHVGHR
jgi:hypothetical protein